jgi:mycofactocin precursor peptide peptidase
MNSIADLTWEQAEGLGERVLVIPTGAVEQHGPHLPLTTDLDIAIALGTRVAEELPDTVVLAPAIPFGASGEHQDFAGTLSIGQASAEHLLLELGRSATCTWHRVLILSTHGGNAGPLSRAVSRLRAEGRDVRPWAPDWDGDAHAGFTETSVMLALRPSSVNLTRMSAGATAPLSELMPSLLREGVAAVSANGVLGDPATASRTAGERLLLEAVTSLVRVINEWHEDGKPSYVAA